MWRRTVSVVLVSYIINASLMTSIMLLLPTPIDLNLFVGHVLGLVGLAVLMTYFYCVERVRDGIKRLAPITALSVCINIFILSGFY